MSSLSSSGQPPAERAHPQAGPGRPRSGIRIVLVTLGTRGDVQPFCHLACELKIRGYDVTFVANEDYRPLVQSFGLELVDAGSFGDEFFSGDAAALFDQYSAGWRRLLGAGRLVRSLQDRLTGVMRGCLEAIRPADLVVYNAMAFFVGEFARELRIPAVRLTCQPLLPSSRMSLSLAGGRDRGRVLNRASYEIFRLPSATLLRRSYRRFRDATGHGGGLRGGVNPLTLALRDTHQLLAFSPTLAPDPGDWPGPYTQSGFLFGRPAPGGRLPNEIERFLAAGAPPVYVGLGSMRMNAGRNTRLVLDALAIRDGRAILAKGAGGLKPSPDLPGGILAIGAADHALLFPRVSAVVHHGGAGTTAAALRAGKPSVVLPLLGDQLFWGRRLAAAGAAEVPIPLARIDAPELAARIVRAERNETFREAASRLSRALGKEPGLSGAADLVDRLTGAAGGFPPPAGDTPALPAADLRG